MTGRAAIAGMLAALLLVIADRDLAAGAPGLSDTAILGMVVVLVAIQLLVGVDMLATIRRRRAPQVDTPTDD